MSHDPTHPGDGPEERSRDLKRIAHERLARIDERRAVHRARAEGLTTSEMATTLGMSVRQIERTQATDELLGDPEQIGPEELILRCHLYGGDRDQLVQALGQITYTYAEYAPYPAEGKRSGSWDQVRNAFMSGFLSEAELDMVRWLARGDRMAARGWHPIRAPRGLDFLVAALPTEWTHSQLVSVLNRPDPDLDDLTPIDWLQEEGSPGLVLLALLTPEQLVRRVRELLGAKLVAYIGSVASTQVVDQWVRADDRPSEAVLLRLATACCAAALLCEHNSAELVQVWFQGANRTLGNLSPARALRGDADGDGGIAVLATADRAAKLPL